MEALAALARVNSPVPRGLADELCPAATLLPLRRAGWLRLDASHHVQFGSPRARAVATRLHPGSRALHARVAAWLGAEAPHLRELRAHHLGEAGRHASAAALWEEVATAALERLDLPTARRCLEARVAALPDVRAAEALDARIRLAFNVVHAQKQTPEAEARLEGIVDDAEAAGHRRQLGKALRLLGVVQAHRGRVSHAPTTLRRARAVSQEAGEAREAAYALGDLAATQREAGDWPGAARDLRQALAELDATVTPQTPRRVRRNIAIYRCSLGSLLNIMGQLDEARATLARGLDTLRLTAGPADLAPALAQQARLLLRLGDFDGSVAHSREAIRMAEAAGDPLRVAQGRVQLAETWMALGKLAEADQELTASRAIHHDLELWAGQVYVWGRSGDLAWLQERFAETMAYYDHARQCCERSSLAADGALCRVRMASCARQLGDTTQVDAQLQAVSRLATEPGIPLSTQVELWCEEGLRHPHLAADRLGRAEAAVERLVALEAHAEELLWTLRDAVDAPA